MCSCGDSRLGCSAERSEAKAKDVGIGAEVMTSKPRGVGLGIAFGAALGAVAGVLAGHVAIWLALGIAIGVAIGASFRSRVSQCPECARYTGNMRHEATEWKQTMSQR